MAQLAYLQQQQLHYKQHAIDSRLESTDMLTGLRMYSDAFSMFDEVMGDQQKVRLLVRAVPVSLFCLPDKILYTYPTADESEAIMQLTAAGRQVILNRCDTCSSVPVAGDLAPTGTARLCLLGQLCASIERPGAGTRIRHAGVRFCAAGTVSKRQR